MQKTIQLASNLLKNSGLNETYLPQVKLFINETTTEKMPLLYKQGIIFVLQGEKCIYEQSNKIIYNKENMLVLTVPMPLSCKAFALDNKPIISMLMDIETSMLNQLIDSMEHTKTLEKIDKGNNDKGLFITKVSEQISSAIERLLTVLQNHEEAEIFGKDIMKEILYCILKTKEATPLYALALKNTNLSKIEKALQDVQVNYSKQYDVESLAKSVNMSVSSFHQAFKNVTSTSPIQYLKKIRLSKAKDFLVEQNASVTEAALHVGYESVSQFNREFKRYYGVTPGSINR